MSQRRASCRSRIERQGIDRFAEIATTPLAVSVYGLCRVGAPALVVNAHPHVEIQPQAARAFLGRSSEASAHTARCLLVEAVVGEG